MKTKLLLVLVLSALCVPRSAFSQTLTPLAPYSIDTHDPVSGWVIGGTITDQTDELRYDYVTDPGEVLRLEYNGVLSPNATAGLDIEIPIPRNADGTFPTLQLFVETPAVTPPPAPKLRHKTIFQLHRKR